MATLALRFRALAFCRIHCCLGSTWGRPGCRQNPRADDKHEHLAAPQGLRAGHLLPRAEATRLGSPRGNGGLGAESRPRRSACVARPRANRYMQFYTSIKPSQLKRALSFYETKATKMLSE